MKQSQDKSELRRFTPSPQSEGRRPRAARAGPPVRPGVGLRVLVVDDEPLVAAMICLLLESAGHGVTLCLEGQQALEAFQRSHYDVALVDLGMPRPDGWEVSRQINQIRPGVPVIVVTGWSTTVADGEGHGAVIRKVLRKPFGMRELAGAIIETTGVGANEVHSGLVAQTGPHPPVVPP